MTCDGGTADFSSITRCGNNENAALRRIVKNFFEATLTLCRGVYKSGTQVNDVRVCVDAVDNCGCEFFGSSTWHLAGG